MSSTSVDLPLPDRPVTQVKQPTGKCASTFLRLFSLAPMTLNQPESRTSLVGCGGGGEVSTISGSELQQYTTENADEIAKQEAIDEAEEAAEDEDEDE